MTCTQNIRYHWILWWWLLGRPSGNPNMRILSLKTTNDLWESSTQVGTKGSVLSQLKCISNIPWACWTHLFLAHYFVCILYLNHVFIIFIRSCHMISLCTGSSWSHSVPNMKKWRYWRVHRIRNNVETKIFIILHYCLRFRIFGKFSGEI